VIDIFILLILHSTGSRKKSVESLFKSKVKGGLFTEELIGEVFSTHVQAIQDYFPSILALAELLMCTNVGAVQSFAGVLYRHMFTCFDVYCQEVSLCVCVCACVRACVVCVVYLCVCVCVCT